MLSHKKSLDILRKTNALLEGHFVLSSGLHSSKYIQCAKLLSFPHKAEKICKSLAGKIKKKFKNFDLILSPAMGGIIIGYEIGRLLKKETIFCERVKGKFQLRRGFQIKKGSKVLIIEDVITTGKSSMECVKLIKNSKAKLIGFAINLNEVIFFISVLVPNSASPTFLIETFASQRRDPCDMSPSHTSRNVTS